MGVQVALTGAVVRLSVPPPRCHCMNRRTSLLVVLFGLTVAAAVWWQLRGQDAVLGPPPDAEPAPEALATIEVPGARVRLEAFVSIPEPITSLTHANDGSDRLFVTGKHGQVWMIAPPATAGEPVVAVPWVDLSELVGPSEGERGLLSVAFEPDFAVTGRLYSNYTDADGHTVIARHTVESPRTSYPGTVQHAEVLRIEQPYANHNGGQLQFGPDGMLYVGMGDGGSGGDPDDAAERFDTLLGKLLRIDVRAQATYRIPPDNPFAGFDGNVLPEIMARGLRNPWRFSFDPEGQTVWIADVGQGRYEEVNRIGVGELGGAHFGWDTTEGSACFEPEAGCSTEGITLPVHTYAHDHGCSITGGYVVRGQSWGPLSGAYVFSDFCTGAIEALVPSAGTLRAEPLIESGANIASFGLSEDGDLYVLALDGRIWKLVPTL